MKMIKKLFFTLVLTLLFGLSSSAQTTYWVTSGGAGSMDGSSLANAFANVSDAVTAAAVGNSTTRDIINISGTVAVSSEIAIAKHLDFVGMSSGTLNITGSDGLFDYASAVTNNFTDLTFTGSTKTGAGGVFETSGSATLALTNCTFTSNSATTTGGVFNLGATTALTITNCTFTSNSATGGTGGVINNGGNGAVTISGSLFNNNTSSTQGGALSTYNANASWIVSNTTFTGNGSSDRGAALLLGGNNASTAVASTFTNVTIYDNVVTRADNIFGAWAAVRIEGNSTTLKTYTFNNCLVYNNTVTNGSGSTAFGDFGGSANPTTTINNCISGNLTNLSGSIVNSGSTISTTALSSTTLAFNSPNVTFGAPSSISDATPIDFGTDGEDIGAWDSNINLFKGTTDSDWATAGNWSGTVPTSTDNVTLLSDSPALVIGSTTGAVCNDLSVNGSSSLTINAGGSLIVSGSSTGNVTYNRTLTFVSGNANGWHLVSSPVAGVTFNNSFATTNSLATSSTRRGIAHYNDANAVNAKFTYLESDDSNASTFNSGTYSGSGVGYAMKRGTATGTVAFTGTINTSDVNGVSVSTGGNGYNLLGVPYTSYVSSQTFLTANSNLVSTIWTWAEGSGYTARPSGDNFILAPGQGFFVDVNSGSTVNFAESNQSSGTDNFQKSTKTQINLTITDGNISRKGEIRYLDNNATNGFDNGYEGKLFGGINHALAIYTHLLSESVGEDYQIQSLPNSDLESMVIPVGIKAASGKEITISAEVLNLPQGLKVFLEDRDENTFTELNASSTFKTTLTSDLNGIGRFYLHTKSSALSTDIIALDGVSIYSTSRNNLRVVGLPQGVSKVKLFNILGKQVLQSSFTSNGVHDVNLPSLSTGIYIIQLETENGKLNKKINLE